LFITIECDKSLAKEINATPGVSESNIMTCMAIIEDRVTEILHAYGIIMSNVIIFYFPKKIFFRKTSKTFKSMLTGGEGILTREML
jgi:hypothetical protein